MKLYGWTEEQVFRAFNLASERLGYIENYLTFRNPQVISERCKRGGQTLKGTLRFIHPTSRLLKRDRQHEHVAYLPGVLVRERTVQQIYTVVDPIPYSELTDKSGDVERSVKEYVTRERSCGVPCWHAFGHFFRALFEINPEGKVVTAKAVYDGAGGFRYHESNGNIGSSTDPLQYSDACKCYEYGVESF